MPEPPLALSDEVATAVDEGTPVVALESTVYSTLGLPAPANEQALTRCLAAVRSQGAVPALTVVFEGVAHVGVDPARHDRVLAGERKVAARDLAVASAAHWPVGVTTVSASLALAAAAGVRVFATGGIGGVHRDVDRTGDVSADLPALAEHPVVTVCAGAKAFLDLPRTLEVLETFSVPVLGWRTDELPAFYTSSSGIELAHRVEDASEVAAVERAHRGLARTGGILLCVPIPAEADPGRELIDQAIETALRDAEAAGVHGAGVTPFVLERIATATGGRSVPANIELVANNARTAAGIAVALAD